MGRTCPQDAKVCHTHHLEVSSTYVTGSDDIGSSSNSIGTTTQHTDDDMTKKQPPLGNPHARTHEKHLYALGIPKVKATID